MNIEPLFRTHINNNITPTVHMNRALNPGSTYVVQQLISKTSAGMGNTMARIQLDIYSDTYGGVKATAVEVTDAIKSFSSAFATYRDNEIEFYESDPDVFRVTIDALLYYEEEEQFG